MRLGKPLLVGSTGQEFIIATLQAANSTRLGLANSHRLEAEDNTTFGTNMVLSRFQGIPRVCIIGLGFVGTAMSAAVADADNDSGDPAFVVIGLDRDTPEGRARVEAVSAGQMPFSNPDAKLAQALARSNKRKNLTATTDAEILSNVQVAIIDINLDLSENADGPSVNFDNLRSVSRMLAQRMPEGSLVILETTVPPGTCAKVVATELEQGLAARGLSSDALLLAHSYERVMPGPDYFDSIVNYWRVYAGHTPEAADACEAFLSKIVNVRDYPLRRLSSTTASEIAKVLENSYRATNIAFIEEWGRLAEAVDVDLFEVISAIRQRPTHNNIRQPGFGVGGYCLTKDPLFGVVAANELFADDSLRFPFCELAVETNKQMPLVNLERLDGFAGGIDGKTILLLGVAYRSEVDDTRYAPAELFYRAALEKGATVRCHDPYVRNWQELDLEIPEALPDPEDADIVVFAVPHQAYQDLDVASWLKKARPLVYDCDNVLNDTTRASLNASGVTVKSTGRGNS